MDKLRLFYPMNQFLEQAWKYISSNPLQTVITVLAVYISWKLFWFILRYLNARFKYKNLVYLRVTLPREDTPKDKDKQVEKDFREKIAIMEQFYRNLHEIRELNLGNRIRTLIFRLDVVSFEFIVKNKILDFYVVTYKRFQDLLEKQITSYYSDADIQQEEPYKIGKKGYKMRSYYAYLKRSFWFPIKTFKTIENDPLNNMTNVFSKLAEDEEAVIQIMIRPRSDKWRRKAEKIGTAYFKGQKKIGTSGFHIPGTDFLRSFFSALIWGASRTEIAGTNAPGAGGGDKYIRMLQTNEEIAKYIGEKASQVGFDTVIRLFASGKTRSRVIEMTNAIAVALNLFKNASMNWFQTRRIVPIDFINNFFMLCNFKRRYFRYLEKSSIFVPEELASLYHFPSSLYNYTPIIRWLSYKALPAPPHTPTDGILLGYNVYRGAKKEIHMLKKDRLRHCYVVGQTGTGKSTFIGYLARQDIKNGEGVCVIDPHGDLIEDILQYVPKERAKDVVVFDPSDKERPMGLNILEAKTPEQQDMASVQATEIFIKLFGDEIFGPRIQHYFRNACLTLMEDEEEGATLIDVPRVFTDDEFMKYKVSKVKNPVVRSFWEHEYAHTGERERQEMIPYFSAKFGPFITNSIMRNTIGQTKSAFNFREIMDQGKILLVNLSKGRIGDLNTQLLGLVLVARIQMAAMSRVDTPEPERKDFFLYVDEFQSFATDSFCAILSEARKYHLGLIMAHQYINQLITNKYGVTTTQVRDAVFGNVGTLMSFKVGADDAEYLAKEFAPALTEQDIVGIANFKVYIRLNINNATSRPFSMDMIYDTKGRDPKVAKIIKEYSRMKYGRKKIFVDQEIAARIGINMD